MSSVRLADKAVLSGRISMPLNGVWWADLFVDTDTLPTGSVTLESLDGLSLQGTIVEPSGVELETAHVRVVGGAAGLGETVSGAYRSAKLRDPLNAIARASGESLSDDIDSSLLAMRLPSWTLGVFAARRALSDLARFAEERLDAEVNWRFMSDGKLWIGKETWEAVTLPETDTIEAVYPSERRTVLAVETLSILPGVELTDVGQVRAVDHWIEPDSLRSFLWL